VVTIVLVASSPDYKRWHDLVLLTWAQPFPSFHTICNDLELEKIELDHSVAYE
jgi:hypothetical protein